MQILSSFKSTNIPLYIVAQRDAGLNVDLTKVKSLRHTGFRPGSPELRPGTAMTNVDKSDDEL